MRLAFAVTELGLQRGGVYMGGNVNNVRTIAKELTDRGHEIHVLTTVPRDAAPDPTGDIDWATVHEIDPRWGHGTPGYFAAFTRHVATVAGRLDADGGLDALTVHAGFPLWAAMGRYAKTRVGCPVVHVQYCPIGQPSGGRLYDALQRPWLCRRYFAGVDALVGVSPGVSRSLEAVTGRDDVETVLPAIDTDVYAPIESDETPDEPVVSYLGSLKPQKGLDLLVDAFDEVRTEFDCRLALGLEVRFERDDSAFAQRLRNDEHIDVQAVIDDVPRFLGESDVFAVPFRTTMGPADYPVAALEAMSCGVPLLATDVGGLGELVAESDGGVPVDEPAVDAVADGLRTLLDGPGRRRSFGERGREFVVRHCSVAEVGDRFESIVSRFGGTVRPARHGG